MLKYFRTEAIFIFDKITEKIKELIRKAEEDLQVCFYCQEVPKIGIFFKSCMANNCKIFFCENCKNQVKDFIF